MTFYPAGQPGSKPVAQDLKDLRPCAILKALNKDAVTTELTRTENGWLMDLKGFKPHIITEAEALGYTRELDPGFIMD